MSNDNIIRFEIKSFDPRRKDKPPYVVEGHDGGKRWTCTCPHWMYRLQKSGTRCKHIDKAIEDMKRNERIQQEIAKEFEKGSGIDWEDPPKPDEPEDDDVSVDNASGV